MTSSIISKSSAEITCHQLSTWRSEGRDLRVLDVRNPDEYQEAHLSGSLLIPLDQLTQRLHELPHDLTLVVMCRSGRRSTLATEQLRAAGFDAMNLKGGILQWIQQALPVERG